jgi:microcystin-dependent protein
MQPFVVLTFIISTDVTDVFPRGAVLAYTGEVIPPDFLQCDNSGTPLDIPELDPSFRGLVPSLWGKIVVGAGNGAGLSSRLVGKTGGLENVTLSVLTMPAHSHDLEAVDNGDGIPTNSTVGALPALAVIASTGTVLAMGPTCITAVGGSQPHNNVAPSVYVRWMVAVVATKPPLGGLVHSAAPLKNPAPGEMVAVGQKISRSDLLSVFARGLLGVAPDTRDSFARGTNDTSLVGRVQGEAVHTLTLGELPAHSHASLGLTGTAGDGITTGTVGFGAISTNLYDPLLPNQVAFMDQNMILDTGGAQPHDNMSPYYVTETIMYCAEVCSSDAGGTSCICDPLTGVCSVQATAPVVTAPGPVTVQGKKRCERLRFN